MEIEEGAIRRGRILATYEVRVENRNRGRVKLIQKLSNYQGRNDAL